ncbi:MAG TPA: sulfotransferase family protein, partial [Hyphomonas atlantica]|nr:sulfotransferase family protein [Hyphomonas atlantica]
RAKHGDSISRVQYEQTQKAPRAILQAVSDHWGLGLTAMALDTALAAGTKEAMAEKVDPDAEPNVLQNRKTPLSELFTGEAMDIYADHVRTLFRHDLDYDLLSLPA